MRVFYPDLDNMQKLTVLQPFRQFFKSDNLGEMVRAGFVVGRGRSLVRDRNRRVRVVALSQRRRVRGQVELVRVPMCERIHGRVLRDGDQRVLVRSLSQRRHLSRPHQPVHVSFWKTFYCFTVFNLSLKSCAT